MLRDLSINLKEYLEKAEGKELTCHMESNKIDISPKNHRGSPVNDISSRPTIVIRYDINNNQMILSWIYLASVNSGIGSKVIEMIIEFCKSKNIDKLSINSIHRDNEIMLGLGHKYKFKIENTNGLDYCNLSLNLARSGNAAINII